MWQLRWWERLLLRLAFFGAMALEPGEAEQRFGEYFEIEKVAGQVDYSKWPAGYVVYLMTRKRLRRSLKGQRQLRNWLTGAN